MEDLETLAWNPYSLSTISVQGILTTVGRHWAIEPKRCYFRETVSHEPLCMIEIDKNKGQWKNKQWESNKWNNGYISTIYRAALS